jgi:uncharacterized OB-fold protein
LHKKSPSKIWRKFNNRYQIEGVKSTQSKKTYYPPILFEPETLNTKFEPFKYNSIGKLVSWTVVYSPPEGFENQKPYIVGIVELEDGERLTTQIVDTNPDDLNQGDILIPNFRKIYEDGEDGVIHYGLKWMKPQIN